MPGQVVGQAPIKEASTPTVPATPRQALGVTMLVESRPGMKTSMAFDPNLTAPITAGQRIGTLNVSAPNFPGLTVPLYAAQDVPRANIAVRLWRRGTSCAA